MFYLNTELDSGERYSLAKFASFSLSGGFDIATSFMMQEIPTLPLFGKFQVLAEAKRPDLLSFNIYGTTQFWWLLLLYNNTIDFQELKEGTVIAYPSMRSVEELYFRLKSLDTVAKRE